MLRRIEAGASPGSKTERSQLSREVSQLAMSVKETITKTLQFQEAFTKMLFGNTLDPKSALENGIQFWIGSDWRYSLSIEYFPDMERITLQGKNMSNYADYRELFLMKVATGHIR